MRSARPSSCATIITLRTNGERGDQCSFMEDPVGSGPQMALEGPSGYHSEPAMSSHGGNAERNDERYWTMRDGPCDGRPGDRHAVARAVLSVEPDHAGQPVRGRR